MRKHVFMIATVLALLAACGRVPTVERITPTPAEAPTAVVVEMPTVTPEAAYPAPDADYPAPEPAEPTSVINDQTMRAMGDLARQRLAEELGVSAEQIILVGADPVFWNDASLGCPQPDVMYPQVVTPGYRVTLVFEDVPYVMHTDTLETVVRCEEQ